MTISVLDDMRELAEALILNLNEMTDDEDSPEELFCGVDVCVAELMETWANTPGAGLPVWAVGHFRGGEPVDLALALSEVKPEDEPYTPETFVAAMRVIAEEHRALRRGMGRLLNAIWELRDQAQTSRRVWDDGVWAQMDGEGKDPDEERFTDDDRTFWALDDDSGYLYDLAEDLRRARHELSRDRLDLAHRAA